MMETLYIFCIIGFICIIAVLSAIISEGIPEHKIYHLVVYGEEESILKDVNTGEKETFSNVILALTEDDKQMYFRTGNLRIEMILDKGRYFRVY